MAGIEPSKTRKVYLGLRERIASGRYSGAAGLPGEQALAAEFGVSRVTLRRALAALADDGLIARRRGAGTFLTTAREPGPLVSDVGDVLAHLTQMGRATDVRLLDCATVTPPPAIAEALKLAEGERTQMARRLRQMDGAPFSFLITHVPERLAQTYSPKELATLPLLSLLERAGASVDRAQQIIGAELASPEVAAALDIEAGSALLSITRVAFDVNGAGIEHLRALYRPDRYSLRMDLRRIDHGAQRRWSPETMHQ